MYKDADGQLYTREELDAAPGNLLTEYVPPATGEALQAQLESLGAVIVKGDGDPYKTRYALPFEGYPADFGWFTFSHQAAATAQLKAIAEGQEDFTPCLRPESVTTMPKWWHPEKPFWATWPDGACRAINAEETKNAVLAYASLLTINPETGEQVEIR